MSLKMFWNFGNADGLFRPSVRFNEKSRRAVITIGIILCGGLLLGSCQPPAARMCTITYPISNDEDRSYTFGNEEELTIAVTLMSSQNVTGFCSADGSSSLVIYQDAGPKYSENFFNTNGRLVRSVIYQPDGMTRAIQSEFAANGRPSTSTLYRRDGTTIDNIFTFGDRSMVYHDAAGMVCNPPETDCCDEATTPACEPAPIAMAPMTPTPTPGTDPGQ